MKLRVLIVDDEAPARERLRSLLAELDEADVIGEAVQLWAGVADSRADALLATESSHRLIGATSSSASNP